jgi:hypothetical protein
MTEDQSEVLPYFLGPTSSLEMQGSKNTVSRSNTEAEYKVVADTTTEIMWVQTLLNELNIPSPKCSKVMV